MSGCASKARDGALRGRGSPHGIVRQHAAENETGHGDSQRFKGNLSRGVKPSETIFPSAKKLHVEHESTKRPPVHFTHTPLQGLKRLYISASIPCTDSAAFGSGTQDTDLV